MRFPARVLLASLVAAASAFAAPDPAGVGTPEPAPGVSLTLEQCVADALAKNFTVRIASFSADSAQAGVIIAESTYDPVLGVQWEKTVNRSSDEAVQTFQNGQVIDFIGTFPFSSAQTTTLSAAETLPTGGQVTADYVLARDESTPQRLFLNPAYTGNISLNISQPLLQGAGLDYTRAAIQIARLGERIAGLNVKNSVLTLIFNVETAYFNVTAAQRQHAVAEDTLRLAQQLLDENTIKRRTGVLTDLDVVQAQAGVATARSHLIGFRQAMENAEDILLQAMGERDFKTEVGPIALTPEPTTEASFDLSYKLARDNGPNLAIVQATIEQLQLDALRAKRNALPQLSLNGGGGYSAERTSYGGALEHAFSGPGYNWQAGVNLSFPWGLRQSRALLRQARDNVRAEQATLDQTDQALTVNVRAAVRAIQANRETVAAAQDAVRLSEKQYELQKAKFDNGLATSYDVLQAQNQLESGRVTLIQAQVNLRVAVADLSFLEGTSLDHYHVRLKS